MDDDDDYCPFDLNPKKRIPPFKVDETIDNISKQTKIPPTQLKALYRTFKQECPKGYLDLGRFIEVFTMIYPFAKADQYATLIFRTMDKDVGSDEVSFKSLLVWLTRLRNGTYEDKIRWIFKLYDLDGKGHVTQADIKTMIVAVHQLMDERVTGEGNTEMDIAAQRFFMRHGINPDELPDSGLLGGRGGVVGLTYEDFLRVCLKDEDIKEGIQALTSPEFDDDEF